MTFEGIEDLDVGTDVGYVILAQVSALEMFLGLDLLIVLLILA